MVKHLLASAGDATDVGLIPGLGRSPRVGNCNTLQYSYWKVPFTEKPGRLQSMVWQKRDMTEQLSTHIHTCIIDLISLYTAINLRLLFCKESGYQYIILLPSFIPPIIYFSI